MTQCPFDDAPVPMHDVDANGMVMRVNEAECALLGKHRRDLVGRPVWELVSPEDRELSHTSVMEKLAGARPLQVFMREYVRSDGSRVIVEIHEKHIVDSEGSIGGMRSCLLDVTRREEALKRLEAADKARSEFFATMSHEIRTPLNGLIGMAGLLGDTPLTETQQEIVSIIRASGEALLVVINDVLDLSRIEAGRVELESLKFDIRNLLEETIHIVAGSAAAKGLDLNLMTDPSLPAVIEGDAGRIRQVLLNLLGNAIKFTEFGEVICVARVEDFAGKPGLLFEVQDTGIGIRPDVLPRLFESFTQADSSTTRKYGGSGLGLAISKRLVELMGGEICAKSLVGEGSRFWFRLPVVCGAPPVHSPVLRGSRVLVVSASPVRRGVLRQHLTLAGAEAVSVASQTDALRLLSSGPAFQLVLLEDLSAARLIRLAPAGSRVKLLLLSSVTQALESPIVDARLAKPVRRSALIACATRLLRGEADSAPAAKTQPSQAAAGLRVLVAEDQKINQRVAELILQKLGCQVEIANSGEAAIRAVRAGSYDLILMDCEMPEMDGLTAARKLRAEHGDTCPPIIALTADDSNEMRERCLAAGMTGYLAKPLKAAELEKILTSSSDECGAGFSLHGTSVPFRGA